MRKFIDIIESSSGFIPNFEQFVTPALIDSLINHGTWTAHGSSLEDWWEEGSLDFFDGEDEGLAGLDFHSAVGQDRIAVAAILTNFVRARAVWINRSFSSGDHGIPPVTPQSSLHRAIMVNDVWIAAVGSAQKGALPLGIYWGLDAVEPWGIKREDAIATHPHCVEITTRMDQVQVNWEETFRSRLDWLNGDEESEIQLYQGSEIGHIEQIMYQASDTRPDLARANTEIPVNPSTKFIA